MNRIDKLLNELNDAPAVAQTAKTASAQASPLDAAIENALGSLTGTPKTASAAAPGTSPVNDLLKLAHEVREADTEGEVKLAHRMGAAFTDGMMERLDLYRAQAEELDKTAGYAAASDLEKFAAENPAQYAALVRAGYLDDVGGSDKEAFDAGFVEKAAEIHALTSAHFVEGYRALERALA